MIAATQTMMRLMEMRMRKKKRRLRIRCQLIYHLNRKSFRSRPLWKKTLSCTRTSRNYHKSNQNIQNLKLKIPLSLKKNILRSQLKLKNNLADQLKSNISILKCQKLSVSQQKQMHIYANFTHINLKKSKPMQKKIN